MALPTQIDEWLAKLGARAEDVDERFVRGSGPGGQKINKTSSTVGCVIGQQASKCVVRPSVRKRRIARPRGSNCARNFRPANAKPRANVSRRARRNVAARVRRAAARNCA